MVVMKQHGTPLVLSPSGQTMPLQRVLQSGSATSRGYNEAFIQDLVIRHPNVLPLSEIDPTCVDPIPVCDELPTPAGPIDVFMITRSGVPVLVECKLWSNPQARREVVGQIIDYAKELQRWSFEDLQRSCASRIGSGFNLFEHVLRVADELDEATFIDSVTRNLRDGRCVLLVVGDGIREGVEAIGEYLTGSGTLQFSFGLIELPVFEAEDGNRIVTPRTLAKTTIIGRYVVEINGGGALLTDHQIPRDEDQSDAADPAKIQIAIENRQFWTEFLNGLTLDDSGQEIPKATDNNTIYFWLPAPRGAATIKDNWITVYLSRSTNQVGVFFTGTRTGIGGEIARSLMGEIGTILDELGPGARQTEPTPGKINIGEARPMGSLSAAENREMLLEWLRERINRYVNVFRHRVEAAADRLA